MVVRVKSYPEGPRVWICGQRVHHGASGLLLAVGLTAARHPRLAAAALCAVLHDRHDWRVWFAREKFSPAEPLTTTGAIPTL